MNINCVICSDLFAPNIDIYVTQCGHMFHFHCLVNWFERSKTCPQCRSRANEKNIHRVFFNFLSSDNIKDDAATLQNKLDNLNFQMTLKEKDIKIYEEKYKKVKTQNIELRKEIKQLEDKDRAHESVLLVMKEKISYLRTKANSDRKLAEEILLLRNKLKEQENLNLALTGTREDVNDMLRNEKSVESLVLLAATLKKSLINVEQRKQELEHKYKRSLNEAKHFQHEISFYKGQVDSLKADNDKLRKELDDFKKQWEQEKNYMRSKLSQKVREESETGSTNSKRGSLKRILDESPIPIKQPPKLLNDDSDLIDLDDYKSPSIPEKVNKILESASPYLPVKTNSINVNVAFSRTLQYQPRKTCGTSIFKQAVVPKMEMNKLQRVNDSVAYDGLGGTSKVEIFSNPDRKRFKSLSAKSKKLSDNKAKPKSQGTKSITDFF